MSASLDDLASYFRPNVERFLDACTQAGVPCRVVDTGRTPSEQEVKLATGVSWTQHSKHLPQPPEMKSEAVDVVPLAILQEHKPSWDPDNILWRRIGEIGEGMGLKWGGRWLHINNGKGDPGHFEYQHV